MKAPNIFAVCILAVNDDDDSVLMLDAGRKGRGTELPGGKIDDGETPEEAAAREMREETGLVPTGPLHHDGHLVATFLTHSKGAPISTREGSAFWGNPKLLLEDNNTYAAYNREVLRAVSIIN